MDYRKSYAFPHYRAMSSCRDMLARSQEDRAVAEALCTGGG